MTDGGCRTSPARRYDGMDDLGNHKGQAVRAAIRQAEQRLLVPRDRADLGTETEGRFREDNARSLAQNRHAARPLYATGGLLRPHKTLDALQPDVIAVQGVPD